MAEETAAELDGEHAWDRWLIGWHVAFWLLSGLAVLWLTIATSLTVGQRVRGLLLIAVLGGSYLVLIQRRQVRAGVAGYAYLIVAIVVTGLACALNPTLSMLLFIVYAQVWMFSSGVRSGAALAAALTVSAFTGFVAYHGWQPGVWRSAGPPMLVGLLFSLLLGFWISRIVGQSGERADLIAELRAARTELAEVDHARGVVTERERMAREIHDTLAQGFTSIVMLAQAAVAELPADPGQAVRRLEAIEDVARENLAESRALVAAFGPVALADTTLHDAVQRLAQRFAAETGLDVEVQIDPLAGLSRDQEVVVVRTVQEALTNVRRHARARQVVVRLVGDLRGARVEVGDDGVGFEPAVAQSRYGLTGMRGRVEEVGGELDVDSRPGGGTLVVVRLPQIGPAQ